MSLRGGADGHVLVHGGPSSCRHRHAPSLPLPNTGNHSVEKDLPSVLPRDQLPLPQRAGYGVVHRGVGPASQNSPEGPDHRGSKTSLVRDTLLVILYLSHCQDVRRPSPEMNKTVPYISGTYFNTCVFSLGGVGVQSHESIERQTWFCLLVRFTDTKNILLSS